MKIAAAAILVLAIVIGVVPQFTDCQSQGRALALTNGKTVPMKCHWTAQAALAIDTARALPEGRWLSLNVSPGLVTANGRLAAALRG